MEPTTRLQTFNKAAQQPGKPLGNTKSVEVHLTGG